MPKDHVFWNRMAKTYARKVVDDEKAYQHKLEITRKYLKPDMDVLEFGCGTGTTALYHAPLVSSYLATDISEGMLEFARQKAADAGAENLKFICAPVGELDVGDGQFDVIMGHSILHLLSDYEGVIANVYKRLKPGGVFISSTPCLSDSAGLLRFITPLGQKIGLLPVLRFFTQPQLESAIRAAGFQIDYEWQPAEKKAVFIVAKKAD